MCHLFQDSVSCGGETAGHGRQNIPRQGQWRQLTENVQINMGQVAEVVRGADRARKSQKTRGHSLTFSPNSRKGSSVKPWTMPPFKVQEASIAYKWTTGKDRDQCSYKVTINQRRQKWRNVPKYNESIAETNVYKTDLNCNLTISNPAEKH